MDDRVPAFLEAALLTSRSPITALSLAEALADEPNPPSADDFEQAIAHLKDRLDGARHGIRLERVGGGWRIVTIPELDGVLRTFHGLAARQRLSQAALEVLSIVAHRQPVTLPEINFLRGANSTAVVRTLLDRKLIRLAGRKKVVGKPFLYRTTKEFLLHFGLDRIEELPEPERVVGDESSEADGGAIPEQDPS